MKFNVGDRVKILEDGCFVYGTVSAIRQFKRGNTHGYKYQVKWDDGQYEDDYVSEKVLNLVIDANDILKNLVGL